MDAKDLQKMIRRTLLEEVENRSAAGGEQMYVRVPEVVHAEEYKDIVPHKPDTKTKEEILDAILQVTKAADSTATVVWDDHDDISVSARDLFRVRIIPRWENSYNIEAMIHNEDRVYITNQTIDQVIAFLKVNLKTAKTATQKAYDKSKQNGDMKNDQTTAPDKGLSQKNKPKIWPLTNEPLKTEKNKDRTNTENMTKDEHDYPEKPMRPVTSVKHQDEHKTTNPKTMMKEKTKFPEKNPNTKLAVKISKQETSKFKA